jgi:hypothetical protein
MLKEKLLKKYCSSGRLEALQTKLSEHSKNLVFNNQLSIFKREIALSLKEILTEKIKCEHCDKENIFSYGLADIDGMVFVCQDCLDNYYTTCEDCGKYIYCESGEYFEEAIYCKDCIWKVKQEAYNNHDIESKLLQKLEQDLIDKKSDILQVEFKIDGNIWNIESYASGSYRLGSWSVNSWIDIGNIKADLIKAIDYNLGRQRDKLTEVIIKQAEV